MLFKVLNKDGSACHGGHGKWNLPTQNADGTWTPGEWMSIIEGPLVECQNGYHLCREDDLLDWLGESIYEAEYRGEIFECSNKVIVREARLLRRMNWDDRIARLFACWCAERVLPFFEAQHPDDKRPQVAIETARRYANGTGTRKELDAAGVAARTAAWAAARAAAWAPAWDAAEAAAWAVARVAAKKEQTQQLIKYLTEGIEVR